MAVTRAQVEYMLVKRAGKRMGFVEMSTATLGANSDLADPIAHALLAMGNTPVDITSPSDSDLAAIVEIAELLDRAELRLMQNILGNLDIVDVSIDGRSESYGEIMSSLETSIARLTDTINSSYGTGEGLTGSLIALDFASKGTDTVSYAADVD